jgi:O-antigen ligase
MFLLVAIFLAVALSFANPVSQRFFSSFDFKEGSNAGRIETWGKALEIIRNKPWLGAGLGNYPLEIKPTADYREPIYAHNIFLDVAAETGVLNGLIFAGIILASARGFLKKAKNDLFFVGGFLALVVFFSHSLVENPLFSLSVLPLFLIILSFSNIKNERKNI